jgi:hypothetical protein
MNTILFIIGLLFIIILLSIIGIIIRYRKQWFQRNKKKLAAVVITSSILAASGLFIPTTIIGSGTTLWYNAHSENAYYRFNTTRYIHNITLSSHSVQFNTTVLRVSSTARVNISIMFINGTICTKNLNDEVLDFYAEGTTKTNFTIGKLIPGAHYNIHRDGVLTNATIANSTGYIWWNSTTWTYHHYEVFLNTVMLYPATIRTQGLDYFVWMGQDTTASHVDDNITGFNTGLEYIAIWTPTGSWSKWYGDGTGSNWNIKTYDVVQTYLDNGAGTLTFSMTANTGINYLEPRTIDLTYKAYGYNFTGYTNQTSTQLMATVNTTSLLLPHGYWLALWNQTTYTWNYWISGWAGNINQPLNKYDVVMTRIDVNKTWVI